MPCSDVHAANTNSVSIELTKQNPNPANDVDLCSSFCFCQCCQTLSFTTHFNIPAVDFSEIALNVTYHESPFLSPVASIWHPPQI